MQKDTYYIASIRFREHEAQLLRALSKKKQWSINRTVIEAVKKAVAAENATAA
jgi:hypothetical protein